MDGDKAVLYDKDKSFQQNLLLIHDRVIAAITFMGLMSWTVEEKDYSRDEFWLYIGPT